MGWKRLGQILVPGSNVAERPWEALHAQLPKAYHLDGDRFRIFFGSRTSENKGAVSWCDVDMKNPTTIIRRASEPVLSASETPGLHDECGATFTCMLEKPEKNLLYFVGWNPGVSTAVRLAIGLAVDEKRGELPQFERVSAGPLMDRSLVDPHFVSAAEVKYFEGKYHMWYLSGLGVKAQHQSGGAKQSDLGYRVHYAYSDDAINWTREGHAALDILHDGETSICPGSVIWNSEKSCYSMWYAFRGTFDYRIGYAESVDLVNWTRKDNNPEGTLAPSGVAGDFDSDMCTYPSVFEHSGKRYLLYCGNNFSKESGFGIAIWEPSGQ